MPRNWVAFQANSLPVVWARLGQHRFRVLIDTGAARSLVAPAVASSLGLRIVGTERIIGVTGTIASVQMVELAGVGVGQIDLSPFQAGVLELGLLRLGIQAILGVNAFSGRRLQIDFLRVAYTYCRSQDSEMAARRGRPQLPRTEVPRPFGGADWLALTQEPALEPEISICDPHHHFWDFRTDRMPYQCYLLHELADDIHSGHNVRATVFIEARSMYCPDGPEKLAGRLKGPAVRELLLLIGDKF